MNIENMAGGFCGDLHIHSNFSDGRCTIPQIVDFYGHKGFGAIAITDHLCETNTIWGSFAQAFGLTLTRNTFPRYIEVIRREAERAWKDYGMVVIPGFELTKNALTAGGSSHIVVLGVEEFISADAPVSILLQQVREMGGLSIAAHPRQTHSYKKQTFYLWKNRYRFALEIDAWEVANGKNYFNEVGISNLPKIANSDFHKTQDYESWKTIFYGERSQAGIFRAIREQRLSFEYVDMENVPLHTRYGHRMPTDFCRLEPRVAA